jgi:hypothetical protein
MRIHRSFSIPAICLSAAVTVGLMMVAAGQQPGRAENVVQKAAAPPTPLLSGQLPHVVPPPPGGLTPEQERPWFDTFSWQEFIALNWPAVANQRGVPDHPDDPQVFKDAFKPNDQGTYPTVVWGTWKQAYELFEQGSQRPTPWNSFQAVLPCSNSSGTPPLTFLDDTPNDMNQALSNPLIDQKQEYTRYEIRFNMAEYNAIRGDDNQPSSWLYITTNLNNALPITFPMSHPTTYGAIELKAAWKPITASDDKKRYYIVNALVIDPATNTCSNQQMGLVGFHIAHKTAPFTEWVWSTFEQVDNVTGATPSFNNGTPNPPTPNGYDVATPLYPPLISPPQRKAVQVTRVNAIPTTPPMYSTVDLNASFQQLVAGTVWANYQLIATQWPTKPQNFNRGGTYPQDCGSPFPQDGVANTTAETYFQTLGSGLNSCMNCHYQTADTDFSWVLALRAHAAVAPPAAPLTAMQRIRAVRGLDRLPGPRIPAQDKARHVRAGIAKLRAAQAKIKIQ